MYKEASCIDRRPLALGSARAMGNFDSAATAQLVGPARSHERRVRDSDELTQRSEDNNWTIDESADFSLVAPEPRAFLMLCSTTASG